MVKVSLIVSTLGRTTQLQRLLDSLAIHDFRQFELIVVDQNSDDRLTPVLAPHRGEMEIIHTQSKRGVSRGRNAGIMLARGSILAFPDDDCWYPRNVLTTVVDAFDHNPRLDLLSGRTVDADFVDSLGIYHPTSCPISRENIWRIGNTNTLFVRRRNDLPVFFDEDLGVGAESMFQSGEESDFLLRLLAGGAHMIFDPAILVHHDQVNLRSATGLSRARAYAPGHGRVLRIHGFGPALATWFALRPVVRACLATLTGDTALARYKLAWAKGVAKGFLAPRPSLHNNRSERTG